MSLLSTDVMKHGVNYYPWMSRGMMSIIIRLCHGAHCQLSTELSTEVMKRGVGGAIQHISCFSLASCSVMSARYYSILCQLLFTDVMKPGMPILLFSADFSFFQSHRNPRLEKKRFPPKKLQFRGVSDTYSVKDPSSPRPPHIFLCYFLTQLVCL